MDNECVFCKIIQGKIKAEIVHESNNFIAIKDAHPKVEGHTLIISRQHYTTMLEIPDKLGQELFKFSKNVASYLLEQGFGSGFNLAINNFKVAGQMVMHAHVHILPRTEGDGLKSIV